MLVLTPPPHPSECVSGYLHRLSAANGYAKPSWLIKHYDDGYHGDSYRRTTPEVIQKLTGLPQAEAQRVCVRPSREGDRTTVRLLDIELHVSHVNMQTFRICPRCVAQHGRHEAFWHLQLVQWCPIHRTPLLEECPRCEVSLRWNRPAIGRCNCGADLTKRVRQSRCPKSLVNLLLVVRAALYGDEKSNAMRPEELVHLFHIDLYRLMRLMETLQEVIWQRQLDATAKLTAERDPDIEVASILANWPHNFHASLKKRYGKKLENDSSRRSFKRTFPWVFWTLGRNLKEHAHQLAFFRDEVMRFGACYWTQERLARFGSRAAVVGFECEWGSVPDAAALIGVDPRTLLRQIKKGLVPIKQSDITRVSRNYKVNLAWARDSRYSAEPSMGIRNAAKFLGITTRLLASLRAAGVYQPRHLTRRPGGYSVEDVIALKQLLRETAMK